MAQQLRSQSDSFSSPSRNAAIEPEPGLELNLVELPSVSLNSRQPTSAAVSVSADLLNDIVERARIATNAAGAALALRQGDEIVCLAATGSSAPGIGARLNLNSGLSGACAQSQSPQRCDDSETDARVDPELCRHLGIRSMLVVPILRRGVLLGIVEVFSPSADAFGDGEVQALASLSRTISYILDRSVEVAAEPQASGEVPPPAVPEAFSASAPEPVHGDEPQLSATSETEVAVPAASTADHWTTALTVAVILLAIALGWLLGHGGLRKLNPKPRNPSPANSASLTQPAIKVSASASADVSPASGTEPAKEKPASSVAPKSEPTASATVHAGELVISQNGRVIYRQPGSQPASRADLAPSAQTGVSSAVLISPETANQRVAQRVEPEYPEQAREQHIQGPVTLQAIVAKDGSVKSLKTVSGDPQLAAAARNAVRQWRFKPFLQDGKPAEFQTQVTVNFRLP